MGDSAFRHDLPGNRGFQVVPKADLAVGTLHESEEVKVSGWRTKTVLIVNAQAGEAGPPSDLTNVDILVKLRDGKFYPLTTASGGTAPADEAFAFSFEDIIEVIKVRFTPGAVLPGRVIIQVMVSRATN